MILEGLVLGAAGLATWLGIRQADARNKENGPIQLQQGALYQVKFTVPAPPDRPVMLGPTGWQPVGGPPQFVSSQGLGSKAAGNYTMQARWTGPSGTFYAVNPLVAGPNPNKVTSVALLQAAAPAAAPAAKTSGVSHLHSHWGTAAPGAPKGTPNGNPHRRKFF